MSGAYTHRPVLLEEAIQGLAIRPDGVYVDGTLGRGGHSEAIVRGPVSYTHLTLPTKA